VDVANRIVRAGTSECMATPTGAITDRHLELYATLAENRVGLIFTGHMYCERRGQYERGQPGIDSDDAIAGLARLTRAAPSAAPPRAVPPPRRLPARPRHAAGRPRSAVSRRSR